MKLTEVASNPEAIRQMYGIEPSLDRVELMQVVYDREGPKIILRFDLSEYPSTPPEKWKAQGFNRVQLLVSLIGIHRLTQDGWGTLNTVEMAFLSGEKGQKNLRITGETIRFEATFDHLTIDKISAYKSVG